MNSFQFRAFISYSTDPDYNLARKLEGFLESFHKKVNRLPNGNELLPMEICRDGSDFNLKREKAEAITKADYSAIENLIVGYLERSEYLILLSSINSAKSEFVNFEAKWFLENRGPGKILLALTEGKEPERNLDQYLPLCLRGVIDNNSVFFDLRGWKPEESKSYIKVRNFDDACVNLASHLNRYTQGELYPLWIQEENKGIKRQRLISVIIAGIFAALSVVIFYFYRRTSQQNNELSSEISVQQASSLTETNIVQSIKLSLKAIDQDKSARSVNNLLTNLNHLDNVSAIVYAHQSRVNKIAYLKESPYYVTIGADSKVKIWNSNDHTLFQEIMLATERPNTFELTSGANSKPYMGATDVALGKLDKIYVTTGTGEIFAGDKINSGVYHFIKIVDHKSPILSIDVQPGTTNFAIGDDSGRITTYGLANRKYTRLKMIQAHKGPVYDLLFYPLAPEFMISAGGDGKAYLWGRAPGLSPQDSLVSAFHGPFYTIAVNTDSLVAVGGDHAHIILWNPLGGMVLDTLGKFEDDVSSISFNRNGSIMAATAADLIYLYDIGKRRLVSKINGQTEPPEKWNFHFQETSAVVFSPKTDQLISGGNDGLLFVRNYFIYRYDSNFFNFTEPIRKPLLSRYDAVFPGNFKFIDWTFSNGESFVSDDNHIFGMNLHNKKLRKIWKLRRAPWFITQRLKNRNLMIIGYSDGVLQFVDLHSGRLIKEDAKSFSKEISSIIQTKDGSTIIAGKDGTLLICTIDSDGGIQFRPLMKLKIEINSLAEDPVNKVLLIGTDKKFILRYNMKKLRLDTIQTQHEFPVSNIVILDDDGLFCAGSTSGKVCFGNLLTKTMSPVVSPDPHKFSLSDMNLARTKSTSTMISVSEEKICLWDVEDQKVIGSFDMSIPPGRVAFDARSNRLYYINSRRFLMSLSLESSNWYTQAKKLFIGSE